MYTWRERATMCMCMYSIFSIFCVDGGLLLQCGRCFCFCTTISHLICHACWCDRAGQRLCEWLSGSLLRLSVARVWNMTHRSSTVCLMVAFQKFRLEGQLRAFPSKYLAFTCGGIAVSASSRGHDGKHLRKKKKKKERMQIFMVH